MNSKNELKRKIYQIDFALHELVLFLDSHPTNRKALELTREYRKKRAAYINEYESQYGNYVVTPADVDAEDCWNWLESPWPWENDFMED